MLYTWKNRGYKMENKGMKIIYYEDDTEDAVELKASDI